MKTLSWRQKASVLDLIKDRLKFLREDLEMEPDMDRCKELESEIEEQEETYTIIENMETEA